MLPHPVLDRAPGDETSQSPPLETDFVIEPMEVDESDGEDQGVVFPMDTHVVDLNWDNGPSENSEYWLGSRSFQRLNPRHILEHSRSPNRYSSPIADPFDDASTTDDFYFTMAEAESAENSQQLVLASLDISGVNNSPRSSRSSTPSNFIQASPLAHGCVLDDPPVMPPETTNQPLVGNLDQAMDPLIIPSLPARNPALESYAASHGKWYIRATLLLAACLHTKHHVTFRASNINNLTTIPRERIPKWTILVWIVRPHQSQSCRRKHRGRQCHHLLLGLFCHCIPGAFIAEVRPKEQHCVQEPGGTEQREASSAGGCQMYLNINMNMNIFLVDLQPSSPLEFLAISRCKYFVKSYI
jgi:hypothetical protein